MAGSVVVIPCFNEEKTIESVLERVPQGFAAIVVDDASSDATPQILARIAAEKKGGKDFFVLTSEENEGVGASLKKGFALALEKNFDEIFCLDADGQHPPEKLEELSAALAK